MAKVARTIKIEIGILSALNTEPILTILNEEKMSGRVHTFQTIN